MTTILIFQSSLRFICKASSHQPPSESHQSGFGSGSRGRGSAAAGLDSFETGWSDAQTNHNSHSFNFGDIGTSNSGSSGGQIDDNNRNQQRPVGNRNANRSDKKHSGQASHKQNDFDSDRSNNRRDFNSFDTNDNGRNNGFTDFGNDRGEKNRGFDDFNTDRNDNQRGSNSFNNDGRDNNRGSNNFDGDNNNNFGRNNQHNNKIADSGSHSQVSGGHANRYITYHKDDYHFGHDFR